MMPRKQIQSKECFNIRLQDAVFKENVFFFTYLPSLGIGLFGKQILHFTFSNTGLLFILILQFPVKGHTEVDKNLNIYQK